MGEPVNGKPVSINAFANGLNKVLGLTGQKNGKEFFFTKNWKTDNNYRTYEDLERSGLEYEED